MDSNTEGESKGENTATEEQPINENHTQETGEQEEKKTTSEETAPQQEETTATSEDPAHQQETSNGDVQVCSYKNVFLIIYPFPN